MNNIEVQAFAQKASLLLPDTANRRLILPALVGIALGSFLQVKQGPELNPATVFNDMHVANVGRAVSFLNEQFIFDTNAAISAARSFFLVRSRIVNGIPCDVNASPEFDFLSVALGLSTVFPVEVYEAVKASGLSTGTVLSQLTMLVHSLKKQGMLSV